MYSFFHRASCAIFLIAISVATSHVALADTEQRQLSEFNSVAYSLPFTVEFLAADEHYVLLTGDKNAIDKIVTKVSANKLKLSNRKSWFNGWNEDVLVTVGYVNLDSISMTGSGDGFAKDLASNELRLRITGSSDLKIEGVNTDILQVTLTGSGDLTLNDVEADSIESRITGSGSVDLSGRVIAQDIAISGSGDHHAPELRSQETTVKIRGSGDAEVWAAARLNISITGSGDIEYYGNPSVTDRITGSGDLVRLGGQP
ncbi:MAG: DUF2807 domain-containing protein [Gammaproteobacteria bacterium]|nr:DUF2807 domain-containing protein [Gammaproteobacteria bacterium]